MLLKEPALAEKQFYLPFIDGLRGIAILMVLAVHTTHFIGNAGLGSFFFPQFARAGARGVQLFFMLSAFTLFSSSQERFRLDRFPAASFYVRRAFRILPMWWLAVLFYGWKQGQLAYSLPSFTMTFGFLLHDARYDIVPYGWSIFVEGSFYLFLPFLFRRITDIGKACAFFAVLFVGAYVWSSHAAALGAPDTRYFIFFFPFNHWFCFALGVVIYHAWNSPVFKGLASDRRGARMLDLLALVSLVDLLTYNHRTATLALAAFFLAATSEHTLAGRLARSPILRRFGRYCFSIYLLHAALLGLLAPLFARLFDALNVATAPGELRFVVAFPLAACAALAAGHLSFTYFEVAFVRLGRRAVAALNSRKILLAATD